MSLVVVPETRKYWSNNCGIPQEKEVMCLRRWEQIKNHLHFVDNSEYKIKMTN